MSQLPPGFILDAPHQGGIPPNPIRAQQAQADITQSSSTTNKNNAEIPQVQAKTSEINAGLPYVAPIQSAKATQAGVEAQSAARLNGLPPEAYAKAIKQYNAASQLSEILGRLETEYPKGPGSTHGVMGIRDWIDPTLTQKFDTIGNQARGISMSALGLTSGQTNTAAEMNMNLGGYVPDSNSLDSTIEEKMAGLGRIRDNAKRESVQLLGGIPDKSGNIKPLPKGWTSGTPDPGNAAANTGLATGYHDLIELMKGKTPAQRQAMLRNFNADPRITSLKQRGNFTDPGGIKFLGFE